MTEGYGLRFHHLGLAVEKPENAVRFLKGLGYRCGSVIYDPRQNVRLVWAESDSMPAVEVIFPSDTAGPLDPVLRRAKELIYHVCYVTSDLEDSLHRMREDGHRVVCVAPPTTAVLFNDEQVSFYLISGFGLIELIECQSDKPPAIRS